MVNNQSLSEVDNSRFDKVDLGDFMSMMDVVDLQRRQADAVEEQLSVSDQKIAVKKRLRKTYTEMGVSVTDQQLDRAVEAHYSTRWEFEPPKEGLKTTLARTYVNRNWIATRILAPIAVLGLGLTTTLYGMNRAAEARELKAERQTEELVEQSFSHKSNIESSIDAMLSSDLAKQLPASEVRSLGETAAKASSKLASTDIFFTKYCPDGQSEESVTRENYAEIAKDLEDLTGTFTSAEKYVGEGNALLRKQGQFNDLKRQLDNTLFQVNSNEPPEKLESLAKQHYQRGIESIKNRQLGSAETAAANLLRVREDVGQFKFLVDDVSRAYSSVEQVAKSETALTRGEALFREAQSHIENVNTADLKTTADQLKELNGILNQNYTIKIVSRPGEKSGIDRYYNNKFSGWYVIMEAIDNQTGRAIPQNILNSENGRTERVTMWGRRTAGGDPRTVDEVKRDMRKGVTYNSRTPLIKKVIRDKMDNGIVDNNVVGHKERGYLTEQIEMEGFEDKYITRW